MKSKLGCTYCDKTFSTSSNLLRHHRKVHKLESDTSKKVCQCDLCGRRFSSVPCLRRHQRHKHAIANLVKCSKWVSISYHLLSISKSVHFHDNILCLPGAEVASDPLQSTMHILAHAIWLRLWKMQSTKPTPHRFQTIERNFHQWKRNPQQTKVCHIQHQRKGNNLCSPCIVIIMYLQVSK